MKEVIKETIVDQIEIDDLDMIVEDEILGVNPEGHDCEWIREGNRWSWDEHISITTLEKTIKGLKERGATHIQIHSNGDHRSYIFTGTKLEMVSEKDIKALAIKKLEMTIHSNEMSVEMEEGELKQKKNLLDLQKRKLDFMKKT